MTKDISTETLGNLFTHLYEYLDSDDPETSALDLIDLLKILTDFNNDINVLSDFQSEPDEVSFSALKERRNEKILDLRKEQTFSKLDPYFGDFEAVLSLTESLYQRHVASKTTKPKKATPKPAKTKPAKPKPSPKTQKKTDIGPE
ncbi:MAG: hypothetical protein LBF38_00135 [Deltaproteobacteria bacterium]|jgi:hypothetical protein|nr:hypothetical protein [Deltaproteobacteria bacterium]